MPPTLHRFLVRNMSSSSISQGTTRPSTGTGMGTGTSTSSRFNREVAPPIHRGMTELDRSRFSTRLRFVAAKIPANETGRFRDGVAKSSLIRIPRLPAVVNDPDTQTHRRVILQLPREEITKDSPLQRALDELEGSWVDHDITLDYEYWSADQILQSILPEDLLDESPTSFTQKNKAVRTVVNKLDTIDNEFRNFAMEVLAGPAEFVVTTSESGCTFTFDFSQVYWNSRLQMEHLRLVESFDPKDVLVDAFAGVGPFAIPAGKKGCGVSASDLNPASASALKENATANKVDHIVRTGNADGRDWIRQSVLNIWNTPFPAYTPPLSAKARGKLARCANDPKASRSTTPSPQKPTSVAPVDLGPPRRLVDHFVMNLPELAITMLDAYRGLYHELYKMPGARQAIEERGEEGLPMVHCYCFTKDMDDQEGDILARASQALGMPVTKEARDYKMRFVRDVAPKKEMYCLEFRLSKEMVE
ncbi:BZ3500_MvSof-1268-A1-R1_Chr1-3g02266 [Microbotryum saponariae]|uniref:tRNA (guanine(37)-N1)-methyltransferase n=1 Tax=Microbotryum saponariae TaxID=289078 RepID=A0A2X0L547_9BASI|nr:BZ3500_MvSof-1268-A1-R1_Chr1-3g02266 [Microbotryum saponariae]SCZ95824.1 BZ3501_MvSof-1269-A2-R1_Chr1-3g01869 [Microbotryum saponariae]